MSDDAGTDPRSPAEERLLAYVGSLREHPPEPEDELLDSVVRAARWQLVLRPYLAAMGAFASAFGVGVGVSLAAPRRR